MCVYTDTQSSVSVRQTHTCMHHDQKEDKRQQHIRSQHSRIGFVPEAGYGVTEEEREGTQWIEISTFITTRLAKQFQVHYSKLCFMLTCKDNAYETLHNALNG